ncbi:MAG: carbohydrate ABC transporter permease [Chloroflexi bacterium]|nr:carbohydrate ABC transporter permease [Chloroflexota bacterium]
MTQSQAPVVIGPIGPGRTRRRFGRPSGNPLLHIVLAALMIIWAIPALGLLVSSLRPAAEINRSGWWTAFFPPSQFTIENYQQVLGRQGIGEAFINSFLITIPATIIVVMIAAFAAYAFAWMEFRGRNVLFVIVVGLLVIPLQVTLIPVLRLFSTLDELTGIQISGSFIALWLAHTGYGLPFAVYLLRNYFGGLPKEIFESAAIDGASATTAFFRLALPMSVPVLASLVIFQFLWVWNDLLVALVYLGPQPSLLPLPVALANLTTSRGLGFQLLTAAAFISMIVPIIVFLGLQRYFVRGITGGAVKG